MPMPSTSSPPARRRDLTLPAGFIAPCLPMLAPRPPSGPLWLHEVKHDGFRIVARNHGGGVRLYGRAGNDLTERFPLIVEAMTRLPPCTIDGEAVACDDSGVASFELLHGGERDD
jgi:bifunctional non-homologous end joining protein LigD